MAIIKCRECGSEVSSKAQSCPKCGVSKPKGSRSTLTVLGIVFGFVAIGMIIENSKERAQPIASHAAQTNATTPTANSTNQQDSPAVDPAWEYSSEQDKMGKGEIITATSRSKNAISFEFPYNGPQHATLHIRKHPRYGRDVILSIVKGQFLCSPVSGGCNVSVRFDDRKAEQFSATEPNDNDPTALFIRGHDRFVAALKKSKVVRIEATFFHEGNRVMEFDAEGFKPI